MVLLPEKPVHPDFSTSTRPENFVETPGVSQSSGKRKLYHFTDGHHMILIMRDGFISRGDVPITIQGGFDAPWLTQDPSWENQEWGTRYGLRKNEIRLTVEVPDDLCDPLWKWKHVAKRWKMDKQWYRTLSKVAGRSNPKDWHIYMGRIPMAWVTLAEAKNPDGDEIAQLDLSLLEG